MHRPPDAASSARPPQKQHHHPTDHLCPQCALYSRTPAVRPPSSTHAVAMPESVYFELQPSSTQGLSLVPLSKEELSKKLRVVDLQALLQRTKQTRSGKKEVLVERLICQLQLHAELAGQVSSRPSE